MWSNANIVEEWRTDHMMSRETSSTAGAHTGGRQTPHWTKRRHSIDSIDQLLNEAEALEDRRRKEMHSKR